MLNIWILLTSLNQQVPNSGDTVCHLLADLVAEAHADKLAAMFICAPPLSRTLRRRWLAAGWSTIVR